MPKVTKKYVCQNCAYESFRWVGRCPECNTWNSLEEEIETASPLTSHFPSLVVADVPHPIQEIPLGTELRIVTGITEFDRVLGGGIVKGSITLVGGEPGIGKSTLMLQIANALSEQGSTVLYISGEESAEQIRLRAERLGTLSARLQVLSATNVSHIEKTLQTVKPDFAIIDSVQTIYREDIPSAPGSLSQVREGGAFLVRVGKMLNIPLFIIGHVTKEGNIAGPKILEHLVDTLLYLEGESHHAFRLLRGIKNRFGSTHEIGVFAMEQEGMKEITNPSQLFLSERFAEAPGSLVSATIEGSRAVLVEIQALVSAKETPIPRRVAAGLDFNRMSIMIAILERRLHLNLSQFDVFTSTAGGIKLAEPAMDLALALAIASSLRNRPIPHDTLAVGEVGLTGEVRAVNQIRQRVEEARKLGFKQFVIPQGNLKEFKGKPTVGLVGIQTIQEGLTHLLS